MFSSLYASYWQVDRNIFKYSRIHRQVKSKMVQVWRLPPSLPTAPQREHQSRCVIVKVAWGIHNSDLLLLRDQGSCKGEKDSSSKCRRDSQLHQLWSEVERDKNAAKKIRHVSLHMATNNDQRPVHFKWETYQAASPQQNTCPDKSYISYTVQQGPKHFFKASLEFLIFPKTTAKLMPIQYVNFVATVTSCLPIANIFPCSGPDSARKHVQVWF